MKKLINAPDDVVDEALAGMRAGASGDLVRVESSRTSSSARTPPKAGKVGVISGGGSGHEPMHGGFVGRGMLDAACPGAVFTSPVPDQMLAATKAVNGGAGVLHIVKNYTGDIMNFELAAELAKAEGIEVEAVVIADDVAVKDSLYTAGRRGVGGTVLAEKIVGAAAEEGADLATVTALCQKVQANVRSMGMALTELHGAGGRQADLRDRRRRDGDRRRHPRRARPRAAQARHGATRSPRCSPPRSSTTCRSSRATASSRSSTAWAARRSRAVRRCTTSSPRSATGAACTIERSLVGSYITSLEMAGCSITLLKLDDELHPAAGTHRSTPPPCAGASERRWAITTAGVR